MKAGSLHRKLCFAVLISSLTGVLGCAKEQESASYLTDKDELLAIAGGSSVAGRTAAFVLRCTDSLQEWDDAEDSEADISRTELLSLQAALWKLERPVRARMRVFDDHGSIVAFLPTDAHGDAEPLWMTLRHSHARIASAECVGLPDRYDIHAIVDETIELMEHIVASASTEGTGLSATLRLDWEFWPTIASLRSALCECYTVRGAESIIQTLGVYEREGSVRMPARSARSERRWDLAEIADVEPDDFGFLLRMRIPLRSSDGVESVEIPFVRTMDGWRIDSGLIP